MKPNELLQTTWRERNREWIWRIYLPPQIVRTLNNPSATDVVSPGGCAKSLIGTEHGSWQGLVHDGSCGGTSVCLSACALPVGRKCLNYTNHTVMPEAPGILLCLSCLSVSGLKCPTSTQENWVFWVAPSTNHFTIGYFLDMTCLFREINGGFPSLLNFPIFSPDLCILKRGYFYHVDLLNLKALEKWPVEMLERMLPRHLQIIYQINGHWIQKLLQRRSPTAGGIELLFGGWMKLWT